MTTAYFFYARSAWYSSKPMVFFGASQKKSEKLSLSTILVGALELETYSFSMGCRYFVHYFIPLRFIK